jgi:iron complex outermembrane receptor protein
MNAPTRRAPRPATALTLLAAASLAASAAAQEAPRDGAAMALEEIVVTARMREESLQNAPIAISAYTGASLAYRGVSRLDDAAKFVPGLTLENNPSFGGASNSAAIYLRGVGQKEFLPTTDPGVGLYVDGVYVARSVGAILDVVDIERVEVLRGPQGTLFGRNTIGGAISVTTVKPEPGGEFGGYVSGATGIDDLLRLKGSVHLPLGETLAARLSVADLNQDGYVERTDGVDLGDDDTTTGRAALAWQPNERFAADLAFEATRDRENGQPMRLIGIDFTDLSQLQGLVASVPPPMAFIHNVTFGATAPGVPCAATDVAGNGVTYNPAAPNCYDARYIGKDGKNQGSAPAFSEADLRGASATLRYELTPALTLKSISAWRDLDAEFARDGDDSPHRISQFYDELGQEQYTQELQLLGSHERLNWILGLYYFTEEGENTNILDFTVSNFRSGGDFENESWAAFAQATYDITSTLHLTLGARQTEEEKSFRPDQVIFQNYFAGISQVVPPGNPLAALDAPFLQAGERVLPYLWKDIDTSEFTPMANLSWDAREDLMLYLGYSEGFKSGGFTQRVFPPIVAGYTAPHARHRPDPDLRPRVRRRVGARVQVERARRAAAPERRGVPHRIRGHAGAGLRQRGAGDAQHRQGDHRRSRARAAGRAGRGLADRRQRHLARPGLRRDRHRQHADRRGLRVRARAGVRREPGRVEGVRPRIARLRDRARRLELPRRDLQRRLQHAAAADGLLRPHRRQRALAGLPAAVDGGAVGAQPRRRGVPGDRRLRHRVPVAGRHLRSRPPVAAGAAPRFLK